MLYGLNKIQLSSLISLIDKATTQLTRAEGTVKTIAGTINTKTAKEAMWKKAENIHNISKYLVRIIRKIDKYLK